MECLSAQPPGSGREAFQHRRAGEIAAATELQVTMCGYQIDWVQRTAAKQDIIVKVLNSQDPQIPEGFRI